MRGQSEPVLLGLYEAQNTTDSYEPDGKLISFTLDGRKPVVKVERL